MNIQINIPDGKSNDWKVSTFEVSKRDADFHNLREAINYTGRMIEAGTYKQLTRNGTMVMSNTPVELEDHSYFIYKAKGDVLINGLGLGCCIVELLKKKEVLSITVIEKSKDVIKLVAPSFKHHKRVNIICADAFEWKPPKGIRYNAVWHDIWDTIDSDNLLEMTRLHRKYGRRTNWQGSWCKEWCKELCKRSH